MKPNRIEITIAEHDHMQKMVDFSFIDKGLSSKAKFFFKLAKIFFFLSEEQGGTFLIPPGSWRIIFTVTPAVIDSWSAATLVITS